MAVCESQAPPAEHGGGLRLSGLFFPLRSLRRTGDKGLPARTPRSVLLSPRRRREPAAIGGHAREARPHNATTRLRRNRKGGMADRNSDDDDRRPRLGYDGHEAPDDVPDRDERNPSRDPLAQARAIIDAARAQTAGLPAVPLMLFLGLSWFSTTAGLGGIVEASRGQVGWMWLPVGVFVLAATYMMQHFLVEALQPSFLGRRAVALFAYLVLMGFSVSFGFGFYWNLLEARRQTFEIARESVGAASSNIQTARISLARVEETVSRLRDRSDDLAVVEAERGGTCGDNSPPGAGPRFDFRTGEAELYRRDYEAIVSEQSRISGQIEALGEDLARVEALASQGGLDDQAINDRAAELFQINLRVNQFSDSFNAFAAGPTLSAIADRYAERSAQYGDRSYIFRDDVGRQFRCHDVGMAEDLRGVTQALNALPRLPPVDIRSLEGASATMEAFDRLWTSAAQTATSIGGLGRDGPLTPEDEVEIRAQTRADLQDALSESGSDAPSVSEESRRAAARVQAINQGGLRDRDMLALMTAAIVDLMIFIFNLYHHRQSLFQGLQGRIGAAERDRLSFPAVLRRLRAIVDDPDYALVEQYRFEHLGERYVAVPSAPRTQGGKLVYGLVRLLMSYGRAKRAIGPGKSAILKKLPAYLDQSAEIDERLDAGEMLTRAGDRFVTDEEPLYEDFGRPLLVVRLRRDTGEQELIELLAHPSRRERDAEA